MPDETNEGNVPITAEQEPAKSKQQESIKSPEEELAELQIAVENAKTKNEELSTSLRARYVDLIKKIDKSTPLFVEILKAKKTFDTKFPQKKKESGPVYKDKTPEEILSIRTDLPEQERQIFIDYFNKLPVEVRKKYHKRLVETLKNPDLISTITALRGATFEMSRWVVIQSQGLEKLDPTHSGTTIKVDFVGYGQPQKGHKLDDELGPIHPHKSSPIEIDVPVMRDGKMLVYETKKYTRMAYGSESGSRNQILKYQAAIEQGKIAAATVEISGRVDRNFLQWAMGERVGDFGAVPQVEMIYSYQLPSGKEYRFVLKRTRGKDGLKFTNEERYDETDLKIVRAIQQSIADKRIIGLICDVNISPDEASEDLKPFLDNPRGITDLEVFDEYDELQRLVTTRKLNEIHEKSLVNKDNRRGALNPEFANPAFIRKLVEEFQDFLAQNPAIAAAKGAYVLKPEQIELAVERTMAALEKVATFESTRLSGEDEVPKKEERVRMGYTGRVEGVTLDVDHVMMDAIYSIVKEGFEEPLAKKAVGDQNLPLFFTPHPTREGIWVFKFKSQKEFEAQLVTDPVLKQAYDKMPRNKKDSLAKTFKESEFVRSYDWPERFQEAEQLPKMLEGQDRRYQEIQISDPKNSDNQIIRQADTNDTAIRKTEYLILKENIKRAREYVKGGKRESQEKRNISKIEAELVVLEAESDSKTKAMQKVAEEQGREIQAKVGPLLGERKRLEKANAPAAEIAAVVTQIDEFNRQRSALFNELRVLSTENQIKEQALYEQLESLYKKIIPTAEWNTFAQSIIKRIDQNIIKFIYAVTADGKVVVQEEVIRGDVSGRAAHSELAQGRNTYGAGELAFEKIGNNWVLVEINNGSGHYRPDAVATLPYVKSLLAQKGLDVSQVELVNSILRGAPLKDASVF
ncbi:MAG TPA: hypothetical protein VJH75_02135 [Patescibacteria group bacterium]|nr:hypothetical protein [Patescibacteria group bacterium]